jgi:hypothetical protein
MPHFDDVYDQLRTQMTRMAQIQQQVDMLVSKVAKLEKP